MSIPDYEVALRLILACICGGLVGIEREKADKPAGFRTHILVALGATLMTIISIYGFSEFTSVNKDPARIAAQIVTGVGFLGAGTIMREGFSVRGLTTAASIWLVAGIGMAVGAGMYFSAIVATAIMFIILEGIIEKYLLRSHQRITLSISNSENKIIDIRETLKKHGVSIQHISILPSTDPANLRIELSLHVPRKVSIIDTLQELKWIKGIDWVELINKE